MTTSTILGFAGAAVGFYFGGLKGAEAGYLIGSSIGSLIDPGHVDGPRLNDRTVQVSTYGVAIPIVYGGVRIHGNVIWSTDLVEHKVESSGKGGPKQNAFTYTVSLAILLCEGEQAGIRRVWADTKLVYDATPTADAETKKASAAFRKYLTFYPGTEEQMPDPTIEAALGVGNVCAYRGCCYVALTDIPLGDYGNRIPDLSFELGAKVTNPGDLYEYAPLRIYPWDDNDVHGQTIGETHYTAFANVDGIASPSWTDRETALADFLATHPYNQVLEGWAAWDVNTGLPDGGPYENLTDVPIEWATNSAFGFATSVGSGKFEEWGSAKMAVAAYIYQAPERVFYERMIGGYFHLGPAMRAGVDIHGHQLVLSSSECTVSNGFYAIDGFLHGGLVITNPDPDSVWRGPLVHNPTVNGFGIGGFAGIQTNPQYYSTDPDWSAGGAYPAFLFSERLPSPPPSLDDSGDGQTWEKVEASGEGGLLPKQLAAVEYRRGLLYQNGVGPVLLPGDPNDTPAFWEAARLEAVAVGTLRPDIAVPTQVHAYARGLPVDQSSGDEANADLADIVRDICKRAGLKDAELSIGSLAGITVPGYSIGKQAPARGDLQPLQQAYYWDFVESGGVLKAVRRGAAPVVTIPLDDLGASADGSSDVAPVESSRGQESELPSIVNVNYASRLSGYLKQTQYARRSVVNSQQITTIETAVVMTDAKAAQVASVLLYNAWTERNRRTLSTTRKYARLEPTDVVTITDQDGFAYTVRITGRSEDGGLIKFDAVDERPAAYTQPAAMVAASSSAQLPTVRPLPGLMVLRLLDIPILRDADDNAGYYAAASGGATWTGGDVYRSTDGGTTYSDIATLTKVSAIGAAQSTLGDWTGGNVLDTVNVLTVQMRTGELASITLDQLLNQGNPAAIGREVIQFQRAQLLSPGVYQLSGLLRGRRGTEGEMAGHASGESFVFLSPATISRLPASVSEICVPGKYKGVSSGAPLDSVQPQSFTDTAVGLRPFSVAQLRAVQLLPSLDIALYWARRTRRATRFGGRMGSAAPLGEASEQYRVDVFAGSTLLRTMTVGAPQAIYTADQQATDAVADGAAVRFQVAQISATVSAGAPSSVTLSGIQRTATA